MPQLSAFIITKNEAADIAGCLESLRGVADEVIVVDCHSTDETVAICRRLGAKVLLRDFDGFGFQKQYALEQTTGEWAFSIDADERVTPALAEEIRILIRSNPREAGFKVRRNFYFLEKRLRFGGLGGDWVLRLFRRQAGHFRPVKVHEGIDVEGPVGRLKNPLEHHSYPTLDEYLQKREQYTSLDARERWAAGRRFSVKDYFSPAWAWIKRVVLKAAWLDGREGLQYARLSAGSAWMRAVKLKELEQQPRASSSESQASGLGPRRRILIVRTDRLGDVLLTTPVSHRLRELFPEAKISWLVRPYTAPLLEHNPDVDQVLIDRGESVAELAARLQQEKFDVAITAYPRWRIACALWRAGIPLRIGPASKWYSVFFNRRVWQHRSEGVKHEADYNLELLAPLGISFQRTPTHFVLTAEEKIWARNFLESNRITFRKPVVCLHPGSGGSSERWPLTHFMELGDRLQEAGCDVVVTGGPGEDYQYLMIDNMRRIPVFVAAGSVSVRQLAAIFSCVNLVVSNSTGPLHLAVALDVPTVSVYSPIPTCHPRRWGPYPGYPENSLKHSVFMPALSEGISAEMSTVSVETVLESCRKKVESRQGVSAAL